MGTCTQPVEPDSNAGHGEKPASPPRGSQRRCFGNYSAVA